MSDGDLAFRLQGHASELGFSIFGIVDPGSSPRMGFFRSWPRLRSWVGSPCGWRRQ